uniref:Protein arginine methyltransferase NDUFAF7 n=1 Tax=Coturnix japonica TaxID=93934 RepID=A0A8C2TNG7_COTJA
MLPQLPPCRALLATALGLAGRHRLLPCHHAPLLARLRCSAGGEVRAAGGGDAGGVLRHLMLKLRATGPVTVAEYMREALTNPGQVFNQLASVLSKCDVSIHLVEVSPKLSAIQAEMLTGGKVQSNPENNSAYMKGISKTGIPIYWYRDIQDVPQGYSFYLAHEFLDALPIHKFQRTEKGWHEVLVDIDPEVPDQLRFVLSPSRTPATENFIQPEETRDHVEVCPEAGILIQRLACRIEKNGGAALIADYGHDGTKTDTFRGFRNHKHHDVLKAPGTADLTADVDFSYLRKMAEGRTATLGPIRQREFLKNMGIDLRLQVLLQNSRDSATREQLLHSFDMLMNPKKMGDCFHFFALLPHHRVVRPAEKDNPQSKSPLPPVAGFGELSLNVHHHSRG